MAFYAASRQGEDTFTLPPMSASFINRRRLGWMGVLAVSVLLHLLVLSWADGRLRMPENTVAEAPVIAATIITPPAMIQPPPPPVAKAKSRPAPKVRRPPRPRATPTVPPPVPQQAPAPAAEAVAAAPADAPAASGAAPHETAPSAQEVAELPPLAEPPGPDYRIDLPPSAHLKYDVQKMPREGSPTYGSGTIQWRTDGARYAVNGDFGILFFSVFNFRSEGMVEDSGIAPLEYREKRMRRAETSTTFDRADNTISFSSSSASYPRTRGEQDRASVIWQLAGIGRGDPDQFVPGAQIVLFVAGNRDAATWTIRVIGAEDIDIAGESIRAWHVRRVPPPNKPDQTLDIWLAPQQQWYPVRLRFTESNGDYLDMSLSNLNISSSP